MPDSETLDERLRAVERALTDGDHDLTEIEDAADHHARLDALDDRLTAVEDRLVDLEAATQALRGYVGNVRAVNREVEHRADAAIAAVESLDETDAVESAPVEPAAVYPPPRRPDDASDETDDPGLLDRVREAL
jgi:phage shock protein A